MHNTMNESIAELTEQATALFDQMQRIVEERSKPVIESYSIDFYKYDKEILGDKFAPNSRYLWLLHPNGSHLGRIGVLPDEWDQMNAVLNVYINAHSPERMELHSIVVNAAGKASIKKIDFTEGHRLIAQKDYHMDGTSLINGKNKIASIDAKLVSVGPGEYEGRTNITTVDGHSLSREQIIAAVMTSAEIVTKQSGSLFTRLKNIQVNGVDVDDVLPLLGIPTVVAGMYAPSSDAEDDVASVNDRGLRQRA